MLTPWTYASVEEIEDRHFPFPNGVEDAIDDKNWELTGTDWFVDASGFGGEDEPALTPGRFADELRVYVAENPTHGFAITGVGQFQVYVGAFRPV